MSFTMKYTAHLERQTRFTKTVEGSGRIHALIAKGKPWRNGFIERSNRTDKDELFSQIPLSECRGTTVPVETVGDGIQSSSATSGFEQSNSLRGLSARLPASCYQ
jgi:transposase InsO family protein